MIISTGEQKQKQKLARDCAIAQNQYQDKSMLNESDIRNTPYK